MNEGASTNEEHVIVHEEIPSTPEGLHSYIVEELGDTELARRVAERPDLTREFIEGDGLPSLPFLEMAKELRRIDNDLGKSLINVATENDRLLQVSFDRIVGRGFTDAQKEEYLLEKQIEITKNAITPYHGEREKMTWELEAISYADKKLDELRNSFGLESSPVIPEQVHVLSVDELTDGGIGKADKFTGEILITDRDASVARLNLVIHELLHLKSYGAAQVDQNPSGKIGVRSYRLGLNVKNRETGLGRDEVYLNGLNEAVTEELSNRMLFSIPEDHAVFGGMIREHKERVRQMTEEHPEDFDEFHRPEWVKGFKKDEMGTEKIISGYPKERQIMYRLFNAIYTANPERFMGKSKDEAEEEMFNMLARGAFTGNILPFGRLFNETFGHGKFREFGHLQTNKEQEEFLRTL